MVGWNEHGGGLAVKRKWKVKWKENRYARKGIEYPTIVNDHAYRLTCWKYLCFSD